MPFPFTDLTAAKRRPALGVSPDAFNEGMQDLIVAAVTSRLTNDTDALTLEDADFAEGGLPKTSAVKLTKLFTIHSSLVVKKTGALRAAKTAEILARIRQFFS